MKHTSIIRIVLLIAAISIAAALAAGCSMPTAPQTPPAEGTAASSDTGSFSAEDIALRWGNTTVRCGDDVTVILAQLGSDCQYSESPSCNYAHNGPNGDDGMDKFYDYPDASITTCPFQPGGDYIRSAEAWGGQWMTDDGITVGSSLSDIQAAYGTGYSDVGGMIIFYSYPEDASSAQLYFMVENDIVTAIGIA